MRQAGRKNKWELLHPKFFTNVYWIKKFILNQIEFELKSLWQKYTENLNLLDNSNKTIKEFEEKVVNLSNELTSKKNEILEIETENKVLEEEKVFLKIYFVFYR